MRIAELLLPEYDSEMAITRRVLERVPDDRGEWKPHEKAFKMAHLAQLVARGVAGCGWTQGWHQGNAWNSAVTSTGAPKSRDRRRCRQ